ncbi:DUF2239 family protein [Deinococcus maricopensis]|uniref:DUF2239 domain-containing protein n=1 Tax=Deinococcus maricopensis (strain DSM 21211 / LMG 22137 / NRRL B-23946 / LB-34) TaxID=709986 RepID=E8U382_DEIML|nr:DUF2239 family protein [Deinococcus maricopensis]ADV66027.1 Protein of unknown function DUF2239 [Deinococcus maricopensis DSM 21211]
MDDRTYTAFSGPNLLITAPLPDLLRTLKTHHDQHGAPTLIFDDHTGQQVDFDLRGTLDDVLQRHLPPPAKKGPGRPKLGVTSREVTLLPRHWAWLDEQRGGASATLRRLIDDARKLQPDPQGAARAAEAAGRFMTALAGDLPHYEEASRALYAGQGDRLDALTADWPADIRAHTLRLAAPALHRPETPAAPENAEPLS